jgi:F-type H+-transporting ATPase subunit beta
MGKGKVAQVIGTVVDIEFPPEELPALYNAIEIPRKEGNIVLEVEQHIGNNWVRCWHRCSCGQGNSGQAV